MFKIRSPRASPALKCKCETSSTLISYIFFSARSVQGGVNWFSEQLCAIQLTPVNSYPDNSDLRLIRMDLRRPFRDKQSNIIRLIRISHYSY